MNLNYACLSLALLIGSDAKSSRELASFFYQDVTSQSGSGNAKNGGAGNSNSKITERHSPREKLTTFQNIFPTPVPSPSPSESPSVSTPAPTTNPTVSPTVKTDSPTPVPTDPTASPTDSPKPSPAPSASPTNNLPSAPPTNSPAPSPSPSFSPTISRSPTPKPTFGIPTASPAPTSPSATPTESPAPTPSPSMAPSVPPPSVSPTSSPAPSPSPTAINPTADPTASPAPSSQPTESPAPSPSPSDTPTNANSAGPTVSEAPTSQPTASPAPTPSPSQYPSKTASPSLSSATPTGIPTFSNSPSLSDAPSITLFPSEVPSLSQVPSLTLFPSSTPSLSQVPSVTVMPSSCPNVKFYQVHENIPQTCDDNCNFRVSCESPNDVAIAGGYQRADSDGGLLTFIHNNQQTDQSEWRIFPRSVTLLSYIGSLDDYDGTGWAICATGCFSDSELYTTSAVASQDCEDGAPGSGDAGDCFFNVDCATDYTAIGGSWQRGTGTGHALLMNFFAQDERMTMDFRSSVDLSSGTPDTIVIDDARAVCLNNDFAANTYQVESAIQTCPIASECDFTAECNSGDLAINGFFQRNAGNEGSATYINNYPSSTQQWRMTIRTSPAVSGTATGDDIAGKLIVLCTSDVATSRRVTQNP